MRQVHSCCPTALNQEHYTWRQVSILASCLTQLFRSNLPGGSTLYADLPGLRASENPAKTISIMVTATTARPDTVVIQDNWITLCKLTVPTNTPEGLQEASRTQRNYLVLLTDIEALGLSSALEPSQIAPSIISPISQLPPCTSSSPTCKRAKSAASSLT